MTMFIPGQKRKTWLSVSQNSSIGTCTPGQGWVTWFSLGSELCNPYILSLGTALTTIGKILFMKNEKTYLPHQCK